MLSQRLAQFVPGNPRLLATLAVFENEQLGKTQAEPTVQSEESVPVILC